MSTEWSGDGKYVLPLRRVEPYRLWYEFLKLALTDPKVDVDKDFYRDWGDVEGQDFNTWWAGATWRELFSIEGEVRLIDDHETKASHAPQSSLAVKIPLGKPIKETLADVEALLEEHSAGVNLSTIPKGRFFLSAADGSVERGFLKQMNKARTMLRLYRYWLAHQGKDNQAQLAAIEYYDWASSRIAKIDEKDWRYEKPYLPESLKTWVAFLRTKGDVRGEVFNWDDGEQGDEAEKARSQVMRYLRKARKLASNVGRGEFPGKY